MARAVSDSPYIYMASQILGPTNPAAGPFLQMETLQPVAGTGKVWIFWINSQSLEDAQAGYNLKTLPQAIAITPFHLFDNFNFYHKITFIPR